MMDAETAAKVRREQAAPLVKQVAFLWSRVRCLEEQMDFLMEQVATHEMMTSTDTALTENRKGAE